MMSPSTLAVDVAYSAGTRYWLKESTVVGASQKPQAFTAQNVLESTM